MHLEQLKFKDLKHAYYLQKHSFGNHMFSRFGCLLDNWLPGHYVYLIYNDDLKMAVGMIAYHFNGRKMHYTTLCVDPACREHGLGTRAIYLTFTPGMTKKAKSCYFEVRKGNSKAISIYKKIGFKTIKTKPNWYSDPREDAIIMGMDTDLMHEKAAKYFEDYK